MLHVKDTYKLGTFFHVDTPKDEEVPTFRYRGIYCNLSGAKDGMGLAKQKHYPVYLSFFENKVSVGFSDWLTPINTILFEIPYSNTGSNNGRLEDIVNKLHIPFDISFCYSSEYEPDLRQDLNYYKVIDDALKEKGRIDKLDRDRIFLDLLLDLFHSEIFDESGFAQELRDLVESHVLLFGIWSKYEFQFQASRYFDSENFFGDDWIEYLLAEKRWLKLIISPEFAIAYLNSPWFGNSLEDELKKAIFPQKDEVETLGGEQVISRYLSKRVNYNLDKALFALDEKSGETKDRHPSSPEKYWKKENRLLLEEIGDWLLGRYNFRNTSELILLGAKREIGLLLFTFFSILSLLTWGLILSESQGEKLVFELLNLTTIGIYAFVSEYAVTLKSYRFNRLMGLLGSPISGFAVLSFLSPKLIITLILLWGTYGTLSSGLEASFTSASITLGLSFGLIFIYAFREIKLRAPDLGGCVIIQRVRMLLCVVYIISIFIGIIALNTGIGFKKSKGDYFEFYQSSLLNKTKVFEPGLFLDIYQSLTEPQQKNIISSLSDANQETENWRRKQLSKLGFENDDFVNHLEIEARISAPIATDSLDKKVEFKDYSASEYVSLLTKVSYLEPFQKDIKIRYDIGSLAFYPFILFQTSSLVFFFGIFLNFLFAGKRFTGM